MKSRRPRVGVFAGTFDPPTNGHLDIIERARHLFDKTIIAVGINPEKDPLFTVDKRIQMLSKLIGKADDVEIESYTGLTMDYVKHKGADFIVKGIRDGEDLRNELRQANVNMIAGDVETVFLFTTDQTALISSTLIRQIAEMGGGFDGGRLDRLVPRLVAAELKKKLGKPSAKGSKKTRASDD